MTTPRKRRRKKYIDANEQFLFTPEEMSGGWLEKSEKSEPFKPSEPSEPSDTNEKNKNTITGDVTSISDMDYMVDNMLWALKQVDNIDDIRQTRLIAMEVGSIASSHVNLNMVYKLQSMPYLTLDGHQFVAMYYASFHKAFPSMVSGINLPSTSAFENALVKYEKWKAQKP